MFRPILATLAACAASLGLLGREPPAHALPIQHGSTCIPIAEEDSIGVYLLSRVATFTVNPDSEYNAVRILYQLPLVNAGQISLVKDDRICNRAATAYAAALTGKGSGLSGRVLVAKIGTGGALRYVVLDPYFAYDSTAKSYVHLVMDSKFTVLHTFP